MRKTECDNFVTNPVVVSKFQLLVKLIELISSAHLKLEFIALKMKIFSFYALNNTTTYLLSDFCSYFLSLPIHLILIFHTLPV